VGGAAAVGAGGGGVVLGLGCWEVGGSEGVDEGEGHECAGGGVER